MAISSLHSAGVMHRDLSPSNVMIDGEGHILFTSFECAELFGPSLSLGGNRLMAESESKDYHAPEILLGWAHDSAVDCWGFGMLLYFMFLGTVRLVLLITSSQISSANPSKAPLSFWGRC